MVPALTPDADCRATLELIRRLAPAPTSVLFVAPHAEDERLAARLVRAWPRLREKLLLIVPSEREATGERLAPVRTPVRRLQLPADDAVADSGELIEALRCVASTGSLVLAPADGGGTGHHLATTRACAQVARAHSLRLLAYPSPRRELPRSDVVRAPAQPRPRPPWPGAGRLCGPSPRTGRAAVVRFLRGRAQFTDSQRAARTLGSGTSSRAHDCVCPASDAGPESADAHPGTPRAAPANLERRAHR